MKCYFKVQNDNGSEISSVIHYNSSYDLLMTITDFLNNMKRSGWKFSSNTINENKEIIWEMIKENVTVIFKIRNID